MTMSLVGPYLTTTKYNRKQKPSKSKRLAQAQAEHEAWLESMGVGKTKLPTNKQGNRVGINEIPNYKTRETAKLSNRVAGHGAAKEGNTYSGERVLLGVATMHKSNMVPIFADKKEDAKDIAQMRRN
jgi:hypothetical protein